jgi:hypothetical protein
MHEVDRLDDRLQKLLWISTIGFAFWQGLDLTGEVVELADGPRYVSQAFKAVAIVGLVAWLFGFLSTRRINRRVRADPVLAAALQDEHIRQMITRAGVIGFWAVLGTQVLLFIVGLLYPIPLALGARFTIAVGVSVAQFAYLRLRREPAGA